jgi:hypothetical protein
MKRGAWFAFLALDSGNCYRSTVKEKPSREARLGLTVNRLAPLSRSNGATRCDNGSGGDDDTLPPSRRRSWRRRL